MLVLDLIIARNYWTTCTKTRMLAPVFNMGGEGGKLVIKNIPSPSAHPSTVQSSSPGPLGPPPAASAPIASS